MEKNFDVTKVVDSRLTKTEFIDLVVDDITQQIDQQIEVLNRRQEELTKVMERKIPLADYPNVAKKIMFKVYIDDAEKKAQLRLATEFDGHYGDYVSIKDLPSDIVAANKEHTQNVRQITELYNQKRKLENKTGRLAVLRKLIANTADGKQVLELVEGVRLNTQKLLGSKK